MKREKQSWIGLSMDEEVGAVVVPGRPGVFICSKGSPEMLGGGGEAFDQSYRCVKWQSSSKRQRQCT